MNSLTFTIIQLLKRVHSRSSMLYSKSKTLCMHEFVSRSRENTISTSCSVCQKMIRREFIAFGRSVGYSICFTIRNFVIAIVQNALKLFNEFMLWRIAYGIWTRTTIFIISYETNIYYLLNVASVHFTIECVCGVRCLWADVFIQPILHKILMKLPLFIEFIHRFYWVHRAEPIPLYWIYALHRL